ncbi:MAG TPA: response regulator transcription factor, partial [Kribbella sp.]|nr:response regulator transcription factor [Kribbella sp.]
MSDDVIRVFLVDDQELVRAGFTMLVDSQADMRVVGQAGDGGEAVEKIQVTASDVVLMDVRMPRLDGVEATRQLQSLPQAPKVIVLTTFDLDEYAFAAIKAGAAGFLLKNTPP